MPSYFAEAYLARSRASELPIHERRARSAAKEMAQQGVAVRFVRSIFVPADEICFYVFEAASADAIKAACAHAALRFERVVEAVGSREEEGT